MVIGNSDGEEKNILIICSLLFQRQILVSLVFDSCTQNTNKKN